MPRPAEIRFPVSPRDVPPTKAARRLHLTLTEFNRQKQSLFNRGFPQPDATTGNYDLKAIDRWMDVRSGLEDRGLTAEPKPRDAKDVFNERVQRLHGSR